MRFINIGGIKCGVNGGGRSRICWVNLAKFALCLNQGIERASNRLILTDLRMRVN